MTPEEQRIAIAEACGWVKVRAHWEKGEDSAYCNDSNNHRQLPDYLNDLNAMAEAEKTLKKRPALWRAYRKRLNWLPDYGVSATAAQRAEAFLRTLNLWKD